MSFSQHGGSPLRVISLGGVGSIGKNMTVFEQNDELLIVDCGLMFPDADRPGVDVIIPDMSYVFENADRVVGVVLTHGHEDHIGALPFLLEQMPARVWGTPLTLGFLENRLSEFRPMEGTELITVEAGSTISAGSFHVELVRVHHSVRDGVALGIHTEQGLVVHSGDYKFDTTPLDGVQTDFAKLAEFGSRRPILLLSDSTNVERPGFAGSETQVGEVFERIFAGARGRIYVTCFASHIARIEQVFQHSARTGRRVAVAGRSMTRNIQTAVRLGYLDIPPGSEIPVDVVNELPPDEVTILAAGSQGEPFSALTRIAIGDHKWLEAGEGDTVVISASAIPGNESAILRTVDNLFRKGARVIYGRDEGVHVSGHGNREELRLMLSLVQPEYVMPVHGDYRHLVLFRDLAESMGIPRDHSILMEPGAVVEFRNRVAKRVADVPGGELNVDGLGVGDVGDVVLADRQSLAEDGIVLPVLALDRDTMEVVGGPEIYSRGFVYMSAAQDIIDDLKEEVLATYERLADDDTVDPELLYDKMRSSVGKRIGALTGRRPMVVPVILPIGDEDATEEGLDCPDEAGSGCAQRPLDVE